MEERMFIGSDVVSLTANAAHNNLQLSGYTQGFQPQLSLSDAARRKRFSDKSYEEHKMLLQMYLDEMQAPVLPDVEQCVQGKRLVCCETAWNHFIDIVRLSAGEREWTRCQALEKKVHIVKDQVSARTQMLT